MLNTSIVLLRNADLLSQGHTLCVGLSDQNFLTEFDNHSTQKVTCWTNNWVNLSGLSRYCEQVQFQHVLEASQFTNHIDQIVIVLPKSRELLNFWLAQIAHLYPSGTPIYLVGEKNAGIQGASKQFKEYAEDATKIDMARHSQLWLGRLTKRVDFVLQDWFKLIVVNQFDMKVYSIPGVFNHGQLDEGTCLLLDNLGSISKGRILDFACGAGVIGLALKKQRPEAQVDMLDVSAEAVFASQYSAEQNRLDVNVFPSDGLTQAHGRYHQIYSNPPFHTGVKTDYSIAERFIKDSAKHLVEGGELRIVANGFLKYPSLIETYIGPCKVVAQNNKFKVYSARKRLAR